MDERDATARRGFGAGVAIGALMTVGVILAGTALTVLGGLYNVSADTQHTAIGRALLGAAMDKGVRHAAKGLKAPAMDAAAIREGGVEYKEMCAGCHGAPGVAPRAMTRGMQPRPPSLSHAADEFSTEEIFWIVKHGIKMSAMPAFGRSHDDATTWKIAGFVKQLPKMSRAAYAAIPDEGGEHHGAGPESADEAHEHSGGAEPGH